MIGGEGPSTQFVTVVRVWDYVWHEERYLGGSDHENSDESTE
jgi:hypothetical protein